MNYYKPIDSDVFSSADARSRYVLDSNRSRRRVIVETAEDGRIKTTIRQRPGKAARKAEKRRRRA